MSVKNDKATPIICGAIYRQEMPDGTTEYATMVSVIVRNGTPHGTLQRFGYSPERVVEGNASFKGWELYAEPGLIKAPERPCARSKGREQATA
jgi:hypothetical protein